MRTLLIKFSKIAGRLVVLSLLALIVVVMTGCSSNDSDDKSLTRGESLQIPLAYISSEANFYPIKVDGRSSTRIRP